MRELQEVSIAGTLSNSQGENKGTHYERIVQALPDAIKDAPPSRLLSLDGLNGIMPDWYMNASEVDRQYLKELITERWRLQKQVDGPLENVQQDIKAFAKPLLSLMIKSNFNAHEDVSELTLRLYVPDKIIFGIESGASRQRQSTLLEAALHNFEEAETVDDYFDSGSGVYSKDFRGEAKRIQGITPAKIATLCRRLDIGAQYQKHITEVLQPNDLTARGMLEQHSVASERAAFKLAAFVAYLKKDIGLYAYSKLQALGDNKSNIAFYDRPLHAHRLSLMGFKLSGIVLFGAVGEPSEIKKAVDALTPDTLKFWINWSQRVPVLPGNEYDKFKLLQAFFANGPTGLDEELLRREDIYQQRHLSGPVIAYVPDDPLHPLKEYNSLADFMKELVSQLRQSDYQEFFSRFVAQKDKGRFFARVNERLTQITWQQREPLDMGPWWRETAVENPDAEPIINQISGDLWHRLYRDKRDKAIADARAIAVPTGDEDAATRWKRLTSYLDIGWNVFNFAAMLVPGLGEAMLGLMVAQMAAELLEGVEDWSKGDKEEASAHITGVIINFAQLALMGAGHVLPRGAPVAVKPSALVDSLKPVKLPNGRTRLWKSDLKPYEHRVSLPANARPDDLGLYQHNGQQWLRLEEKAYQVRQDPVTGQHRLQHPQRPNAYQPVVEHNNAGAWKAESEQPLAWEASQLMRRLGSSLDGYSAENLAKIQRVSGIEENLLRRLHVEHETPPALLMDTITRFNTYAEAANFPEQILANQVPEELAGYLPTTMTELPRWPESRAVEVFEGEERSGASFKYGDVMASDSMTIKIARSELIAGKLPEWVIESLSQAEIRDMLGERIASDTPARIDALRSRLAMQAQKQKKRMFDALYKSRNVSSDLHVRLLVDDFPQLPSTVAQELLGNAELSDLQHLAEKQRLSLRLSQQARRLQERVRLNRAYEGLYLEALASSDTLRLELGSLASLPGWSADVRIEIRELEFSGNLHASVGSADAPIRKVLILDEDGRYQTRDADNLHLHGADDLYASVLHALPDTERDALGYGIHEGARLKNAVQGSPLSHEQFESILLEYPIRKPAYDPHTMKLRGGMQGFPRIVPGEANARYRAQSLYPAFTEAELNALMDSFYQRGLSFERQISALEDEFNRLNATLQEWVNSPTEAFRFSPSGIGEWQERSSLYKTIRQCWQRTGPKDFDPLGNELGQKLDLSNFPLNRHFRNMPELEANFDHVSSLRLRNTGISNSEESFLNPFRRLQILDLGENQLTRMPDVVGNMPHLTDLDLTNNRIVLSPAAAARLRNLTRLRSLGLGMNPLGLLPDISRMPDLHTLLLAQTGVDTWPTGLFGLPRFRHFYLELHNNPITRIPVVAPGSFRAELLARTLISRRSEWISPENLRIFDGYVESVGLEPGRPYPPRGPRDSLDWEAGMTRAQWVQKQEVWNAVEDEFGSEPFFNEIRKLTESADFTSQESFRADLTSKVWRMLEAMSKDTMLREKLFTMAAGGSSCVDSGAQLFNAMGMEVLIHEAYALANKGLVEAELVSLAHGKSRLDSLGAIARSRVAERVAAGETFMGGEGRGSIDEVEVHLAYMTDLAERLDLPWQSRGMAFRALAKVTPEMIEAAHQRVLALEEGSLLRDSIADQPFWKSYVEGSNRQLFKGLRRRIDATTELWETLGERATGTDLSVEEKARLEGKLRALATELGKPESEVASGRLMTDTEYDTQMSLISAEATSLLRKLTQEAMDRAKLQRVDIPFTVTPGN